MRKSIVLVVLAVALSLSLGAGAYAQSKPVLRVGTDATFPPFEYQDEKTGQFTGFDIDLIKAIADKLGMEVKITNLAFDGLIPGLLAGNYDLVIAAMTITDERAQAVDFSEPYFNAGLVVMTTKSNTAIKSIEDLKGKVVGVQLGTTGDLKASEMKGLKAVKRFNVYPDAVQALFNGNIDAIVLDLPVAAEFVKQFNQLKVVGQPFTNEYYGIAFRKGNPELVKKVNQALAALKAEGKYDAIFSEWFGSK